VQLGHNAGGFGADCDGCFVDHTVDQIHPASEQGIAGDRNIFEIDFRSAIAVDGRIVAAGDARAGWSIRNSSTPLRSRLAAAGAGGDEQVRGPGRAIDDALWPLRT
jgi:hypothetical protein